MSTLDHPPIEYIGAAGQRWIEEDESLPRDTPVATGLPRCLPPERTGEASPIHNEGRN